MAYHNPVMLTECLQGLKIKPAGIYADMTFGGGGHSLGILQELGESGRLLAFDQDEDARANLPDDPRVSFIHSNFRFLKHFLRYYGIDKLDGLLADLGVSSHQFDVAERGFTYREDTGLDMRMNRESPLTAEIILNEYPEEDLARIFRNYGEIPGARRLASKVISERESGRISTSSRLIRIAEPFSKPGQRNKFLSKLFQALRIEVNDELGALKEFLEQSPDVLAPGGRLVVISYHSLEDRLVKNFMKEGKIEGKAEKDFFGNVEQVLKVIKPQVSMASEKETEMNPRARSARLRVAERQDG
jgi:16S rRNA (cytosine1402-N4)-methyltransferase